MLTVAGAPSPCFYAHFGVRGDGKTATFEGGGINHELAKVFLRSLERGVFWTY